MVADVRSFGGCFDRATNECDEQCSVRHLLTSLLDPWKVDVGRSIENEVLLRAKEANLESH